MPYDSRYVHEWSKTYQIKREDNIKLDNPFVGKVPFKVSYKDEPQANMGHLLQWEYSRIWNHEHDEYLKKRQTKGKPIFIKPNINARKPKESGSNEPKPLTKNKKYDNVQSKILNNRK